MAATVTNRGLFLIANTDIDAADIRMLAFTGTVPAAATIRDWNTVADAIASTLNEATVSGYARVDLAGIALNEDDATDKVTLTATAGTNTGVAAGETFTCVGFYIEAASDATRELIMIDEPAAPLITNGGNVTYPQLSVNINQV